MYLITEVAWRCLPVLLSRKECVPGRLYVKLLDEEVRDAIGRCGDVAVCGRVDGKQ